MVSTPHQSGGFTLIELLVVLAILALLLSIAAPRYLGGVDKAKESALLSDLRHVREAVDQYYADHQHYPDSLDELVQKDYLRRMPVDPLTNSAETWLIVPPRGEVAGQLFDIRSGAAGVGENGVPYAEW